MTTESDRIREQMANPFTGGPPVHITPPGVTLNQVNADPALAEEIATTASEQGAADEASGENPPIIGVRPDFDIKNFGELKTLQGLYEGDEATPSQKLSIMRSIKKYVVANQDELEAQAEQYKAGKWLDANVDSSPTQGLREHRQARNFGVKGSLLHQRPIEEGTYDSVLESEAKSGLDILSGWGGIGDEAKLALEFDSPGAKAAIMTAVVRDNLEAAGIDVPKGVNVLQVNPNLQEIEYLNPQEDGSLRWTLADSKGMRLADAGAIADPSEWFSAIGAAVGTLVGKNRVAAEFGGDLVGRNVGLAIEALISNKAITWEEYRNAVYKTPVSSSIETGVSRIIGRAGRAIGARGGIPLKKGDDIDKARAEVAETADAMETIQRLTDKEYSVSAPEATNATGPLIEQAGRKQSVGKAHKDLEEQRIHSNAEAINDASTNLHRQAAGADSPNYTPEELVERITPEQLPQNLGKIVPDRVVDGNLERITYKFAGETKAKGGTGVEIDSGMAVTVDHANQRVVFDRIYEGQRFKGQGILLFDEAWREAVSHNGYDVVFDDAVSKSAQNAIARLNRSGWKITQNPAATKDGTGALVSPNRGEPVYTVDGAPGDIVHTNDFGVDGYDRALVESSLDDLAELVPATQKVANEEAANLQRTIGWSQQRQTSGYTVTNKPSSGLQVQIRQLENRADNALISPDATEADKLLRNVTLKEVDEEGESFLSGLASGNLDLGNLLKARETLAKIVEDTGDPAMGRVLNTIDNLVQNSRITGASGRAITKTKRAQITSAIDASRKAQDNVEGALALTQSSTLFKKNVNGEYMYTTQKDWESMLGSTGSRFIKNMKPLLDGSPDMRSEAVNALHNIYTRDVINKGWTRARHQAYMKRYGASAGVVFGPEDFARLDAHKLVQGEPSIWRSLLGRAQARQNTIVAKHVQNQGLGPVNPRNILESIRQAPDSGVYLSHLARTDPPLFKELQKTLAEETRQKLHDDFFDPELVGSRGLGDVKRLGQWLDKGNRAVLKQVLGEQYVKDLDHLIKGFGVDVRIKRVAGTAVEMQSNPIRLLRSLIGPLTPSQRRITAGNFVNQRLAANRALKVMSDPKLLREVRLIEAKHPLERRQAATAFWTRMGLFSDFGVYPGSEDFPQDAQEVYEEIQSWWISE